ncbi:MAG: fumarylacetoacetate hydrolase family protein [Phototrophicaceae bacterium]|jgi:2-keto-4-pentenoate hydratase/2-oxohepta-3-ene-1,7-dioic acid hydratase in catechol pathway
MQLIRYRTENEPPEIRDARAAVLREGKVYPFAPHIRAIDVIRAEDDYVASEESIPLESVWLRAPFHPRQIIAIGRNYGEHAAEMKQEKPSAPLIFAKLPSSVISDAEPIVWSRGVTQEVDYEGELGVVIGKKAKRVSEADAMKHVYGYTIANDVTARDLQHRIDKQWTRAKGLDTFCPLGPCVVSATDIEDPHALTITTTVNGQVRQQASTADMIFSIPYLIHYCSHMFTLEPGDLILTGTPSGVGAGMTPPQFLKHGDVVSVSISGIGVISNPCVELD